jgi:hypothetical protein
MNILSVIIGAIEILMAFFFPQYTIPLFIGAIIIWVGTINAKLEAIRRVNTERIEKDKKTEESIKTLFDNQRLLLSLLNAVRVRINNFYAKKLKDPKTRFKNLEDLEKFDGGEIEDPF